MCDPNPVREVLKRFPDKAVIDARDTARQRESAARSVGDKANATLFNQVAVECDNELAERMLSKATRAVLNEGLKKDRDAVSLLAQMGR